MNCPLARLLLSAQTGLFLATTLLAQPGAIVSNWTVPPYRGSSSTEGGMTTMTDISPGVGSSP